MNILPTLNSGSVLKTCPRKWHQKYHYCFFLVEVKFCLHSRLAFNLSFSCLRPLSDWITDVYLLILIQYLIILITSKITKKLDSRKLISQATVLIYMHTYIHYGYIAVQKLPSYLFVVLLYSRMTVDFSRKLSEDLSPSMFQKELWQHTGARLSWPRVSVLLQHQCAGCSTRGIRVPERAGGTSSQL